MARSWKSFACAALITAVFSAPALAKVRFGVEAGPNLMWLRYEKDAVGPMIYWDPTWRTAVTAGGTVEIPVRNRLAIVSGLRYVQLGNKVIIDAPSVLGRFRVIQHYVAIPALLSFRPLPWRGVFLSLGPELGVLVAGRLKTDYIVGPNSSTDITDDLERTNLSLDVQSGVEFPIGPRSGTVSARYAHGLMGGAKKSHWVSDWNTRDAEFLLGLRW